MELLGVRALGIQTYRISGLFGFETLVHQSDIFNRYKVSQVARVCFFAAELDGAALLICFIYSGQIFGIIAFDEN